MAIKDMTFLCLSLTAALLFTHAAVATEPRPAPRLYVTGNHGVRVQVPDGLYYCPLPEGWVGSDHGTTLFLVAPGDCEAGGTPAISIFYAFNVVERDHGDGDERPPRTDAELRRDECPAGGGMVTGLRLLGHSVPGCSVRDGSRVTISANAVYSLERGWRGPDRTLAVTLSTSTKRLSADLVTFRRLLAGISICTPNRTRSKTGRPGCHEWPGSWW
jgi:hypothetical protein